MRLNVNLKNFFLVFMILALCAISFSKDKIVDSKWAVSALKIDGLNNDWDSNALNLQEKIDVDYAFMNDTENLYILLIFKDPKFLSSINLTGMTVWLNSEANKKKDYGIRFINKKISADQYISVLEEKMGAVSEAQKNQIRANPSYMFYDYELINKISKNTPAKFSEAQDPKIPAFRNSMQQKTAVYEFLIPLKRLAELSAEIGADPGKSIQVCFEWGGTTKQLKKALAGQISAEATRSTAERPTSSLTGERDTREGLGDVEYDSSELAAMRRRMPKQYSFWVDVKLAQNQ